MGYRYINVEEKQGKNQANHAMHADLLQRAASMKGKLVVASQTGDGSRWVVGGKMILCNEDLVVFLKNFHTCWTVTPSLDAKDAQTMPHDIPPGLKLIYQELGRLFDIKPEPANGYASPFGTQDFLYGLKELKRQGEMIEFCRENQSNWYGQFRSGESDPAVYSDAETAFADEFEIVCPSLDHFLTTLCLQEAVMSAPFLGSCSISMTEAFQPGIEMVPLWLNGMYVWKRPTHHFFEIPGKETILLSMEREKGFWLGSHSEEILQMVTDRAKHHWWPHRNGKSTLRMVQTKRDGTYKFTMS